VLRGRRKERQSQGRRLVEGRQEGRQAAGLQLIHCSHQQCPGIVKCGINRTYAAAAAGPESLSWHVAGRPYRCSSSCVAD
jgi:hypothetical protein